MDYFTQAQSNIGGSYSGNNGNNNAFGGTIININTLSYTTNYRVEKQAPKPHRLIPYARNSTFTGRKNLIDTVKGFSERKGHNRVALYGLGGSGKTQIALEYVHQRASESDSDIFWVQGSGVLKFSEGFRAIAHHVRISLASAEGDEEDFLRGIRRWFGGPSSSNWILVIDNADNEADFSANNSPIAKFIPQGTKGTLIFTTRSRQVASRQGCEMIEVGGMSDGEAEGLFAKRFGRWESLRDEEKTAVAGILGSVHHLPLAIIGSAAFMIETATPPSVYWSIFQENEERVRKLLSHQFCDIQRETDVTESILGTHFVTFDRIREQMPSAADLLWLIAFFDRQNIPEELLHQCGLERMDDPVEFRRAIGNLLGFSLVTSVERENKTFYELHRLVQLSLQVYLPTEGLNQWRAAALRVISRIFPHYPEEMRSIGPAYIQHALAATKDATDPIAEELCFRMGWYFVRMGSYGNAEIQARRCLALREEGKEYDWDGNGDERFMLLAVVNSNQGRYGESEAINRRVLDGHEKVLGPDHPDTLESLHNLAVNRRGLEGCEKVLGPDHPGTLASAGLLALSLKHQGKYNESEAMNRHALMGCEKVLGPDHPDTLTILNNRAILLGDQGKYDESETMSRSVLVRREKVLGPDHPDTLISLNNLALVLANQGKYNESETMNRHALMVCEKLLGADHPDTLIGLNNLAMVLADQRKYGESEAMHRRVLEGRENILGPNHPDTLISLNNLAVVLADQGKYGESEAMHRRVLEGRENILGPDHPDTLMSLNNLAVVLEDQAKYGESEAMHRRALGESEKVLGPDHPDTLPGLGNLAWVLRKQGKYVESGGVNRRVLELPERAPAPDHLDTRTSPSDPVAAPRDQGQHNEPETVNRRTQERVVRNLDWTRPRL